MMKKNVCMGGALPLTWEDVGARVQDLGNSPPTLLSTKGDDHSWESIERGKWPRVLDTHFSALICALAARATSDAFSVAIHLYRFITWKLALFPTWAGDNDLPSGLDVDGIIAHTHFFELAWMNVVYRWITENNRAAITWLHEHGGIRTVFGRLSIVRLFNGRIWGQNDALLRDVLLAADFHPMETEHEYWSFDDTVVHAFWTRAQYNVGNFVYSTMRYPLPRNADRLKSMFVHQHEDNPASIFGNFLFENSLRILCGVDGDEGRTAPLSALIPKVERIMLAAHMVDIGILWHVTLNVPIRTESLEDAWNGGWFFKLRFPTGGKCPGLGLISAAWSVSLQVIMHIFEARRMRDFGLPHQPCAFQGTQYFRAIYDMNKVLFHLARDLQDTDNLLKTERRLRALQNIVFSRKAVIQSFLVVLRRTGSSEWSRKVAEKEREVEERARHIARKEQTRCCIA